jgi:hypothetical protein
MPAASDVQPGEAIDWALIPPRPRTAFWPICLFILGKGERATWWRFLELAASNPEDLTLV